MGWVLFRGWALINFFCLLGWRMGVYSRWALIRINTVYKNKNESLLQNKVSLSKAMNAYECTSVKFYLSPVDYGQCFFQLFRYVNMLQHIPDGLVL